MKLLAMLMMAADPGGQSLPDVVLLDFTNSYCPPCQQMVPLLQRMEHDGFPIRKIDTTQDPILTKQYGVTRIPTFVLLVEGQEVKRFVGLTSEQDLRQVMKDAARKLDMQRRPDDADPELTRTAEAAASGPADPVPPEAEIVEKPKRKGLGAIFAHIREGITGSRSQPPRFEHPTFRGQSPDSGEQPANSNPLPMQSSVRVTVREGNTLDFGTGTIVYSVAGNSTILTCAHLFHDVGKDAIIKIERFQDGRPLSYPAKLIGGNKDSDLAFLRIATASALPVSPIVSEDREVLEGDSVFSIGCSNGNVPTQLAMKIVSLNRYNGPKNIVCTQIPQRGRSGGGLFNENGELIGVCSAADREQNEGLYMASAAIRNLITALKLQALFETPPPEFESAVARTSPEFENPFAELDDDELFDQIFNEDVELAATNPPPARAAPPGIREAGGRLVEPADPFASPAVPRHAVAQTAAATMTAAGNTGPASSSAYVPQEITVIIDSKDPSRAKQVIVIPRPSPWLVQLLSGETPVPLDHGMTTARNANLRPEAPQLAARRPVRQAQAFPVAGP